MHEVMRKDTKILVASDLHYLSNDLTDHGEYFEEMIENADGKAMNDCDAIVRMFAEQVIAEAPEALVLTGDLTFNGEKASHEDLVKILKPIRESGIAVYVIAGNHDVNRTSTVRFEGDHYVPAVNTTDTMFRFIYEDFGYGNAHSYDASSGSYTVYTDSGFCFLMLDVNMVKPENTVSTDTLKWMERELKEARKKGYTVLSFSHQNLLKHSMLDYGFVIENAQDVLKVLNAYDVPLHMSGHMHIQHIQSEGITEIASSSLLVQGFQYGVLSTEGNTLHYRTESVDVSSLPEAENFFERTCYEKTLASLKNEHAEAMADYFTKLNCAYFAGDLSHVVPDPDTAQYWYAVEGFSGAYIRSIEEEAGKDHRTLTVTLP